MRREKKEKKGKCCCQSSNILECISSIDCELGRVKSCVPSKHISRSTKEKVLFCIVLRDIAILEKKIDKILRELTSDCWEKFECDFDSKNDNDNKCDSDSDCDSDCDCDCDSDCDSHRRRK